MQSLCSPSASLQLTDISQKEDYYPSLAPPNFAGATRGHLYITWLWWSAELTVTGTTGL